LKKLSLIILFLSNILILINGCVPSQPTEEFELLPSERLTNKLEANRRKIKNFEGTGTIFVNTPSMDNSATFRIVLQKPDSIYLTILGPFGIELAQALVTKDKFTFYDALKNTAYVGAVNSDALQSIFRINLSFEDLLDAFVGSVNLTNNLYRTPDNYDVEDDRYVLTYLDSARTNKTVYKVDVRQLGITEYQLFGLDDVLMLKGKYSDFELLENVAVPYKIAIENVLDEQKISIDYKKINVNKNSIFIDFKIPDDATIIKW
jgi:outer membrane lipoprotein-sorting protein